MLSLTPSDLTQLQPHPSSTPSHSSQLQTHPPLFNLTPPLPRPHSNLIEMAGWGLDRVTGQVNVVLDQTVKVHNKFSAKHLIDLYTTTGTFL